MSETNIYNDLIWGEKREPFVKDSTLERWRIEASIEGIIRNAIPSNRASLKRRNERRKANRNAKRAERREEGARIRAEREQAKAWANLQPIDPRAFYRM